MQQSVCLPLKTGKAQFLNIQIYIRVRGAGRLRVREGLQTGSQEPPGGSVGGRMDGAPGGKSSSSSSSRHSKVRACPGLSKPLLGKGIPWSVNLDLV